MKSTIFVLLGVTAFTEVYAALNTYEILSEARKVDSSYLCRAIADGNTFGPIYRSVLEERKHNCRDGLVVNDSNQGTSTVLKVTIVDERTKKLNESFVELLGKAKTGKVTYLQAARAHRDNFFRLFPEHVNNPYVNEYLSYMAVQGEQVDLKKITETQAQYELAKKNTELIERAEKAAQLKPKLDAVKVQPIQANNAVEQVPQTQQPHARQGGLFGFSPETKSMLFNLGGMFLQQSHEQALATQNRMQQCVWTKLGTGWVQNCN